MKITYILAFVLVFSCSEDRYVKHYIIPKLVIVDEVKNELSSNNDMKAFSWDVPENWMTGKKSSMRLASYSIPYDETMADVSITNFSGDGGGIEQNINRWRKQLNLQSLSIEDIENLIINKSSKLGNYKFIRIINSDNKNSAFLCSIMQVENSTIFIKLNASFTGVQKLEPQFLDFCSSFKY